MSAEEAAADAPRLWQHIFGGERGLLQVFTGLRDERGKIPRESIESEYFAYPQEAGAAAEWAHDKATEGREVYFCAHLLSAKRRVKENAAPVRTLWGDLDGAEVPNGQLSPTAVVESSPGRYHVYWRLSDPLPPEIAEQLNKRLAFVCGADTSGFDLSQLLRVPGTVNHKHEGTALVRVRKIDGSCSYTPAELDERLPEVEEPNAPPQSDGNAEDPPVRLGPEAMSVWRGERPKRKEGGEVDKSATLMKIGRILYNAGANGRVIVDALDERDRTLGYEKYTGHRDGGRGEYERIHAKLQASGRNAHVGGHASVTQEDGGSGSTAEQDEPAYRLTDWGNAQRFVRDHGHNVHYCHPWGKWLVWDGKRWRVDDSGEVVRLMKDSVRRIYVEAAAEDDDKARKALADHAKRSESKTRITDALYLARTEPGVPVSPGELDADVWAFNTLSGTLDLQTGEIREHRREDLITKVALVEYDPEAEAPRFMRFINEVFEGDEDRIAFVQRFAGYSLTGSTEERAFAILHGSGKNGKTTLVELLRDVLGDYARNTDTETVLRKRHTGIGNDVAALKGARFVSAAEVEKGRALAESKIKNLTGTDTVTARFLFAEPFDFRPEFKLWLSTNNKPVIHGTDDAIWDRIRLIPFDQRFTGAKADRSLPRKLREELPGVLAWMVRGCMDWQRDGLGESDKILEATQGYRTEMDALAAFIEECCIVEPSVWCKFADLYAAYGKWCEDSHEHPESSRRFADSLTERGFEKDTGKGNVKIRRGIALRHDGGPDPARVTDPEANNGPAAPEDGTETENNGNPVTDPPDFGNPQNTRKSPDSEKGVTEGYPKSATFVHSASRVEGSGKTATNGNFGNFGNPNGEKTTGPEGTGPEGSSSGCFGAPDKAGHKYRDAAELLEDPPDWLAKQLVQCRANPNKLFKPTAAALSHVLYGTTERADELAPALVAYLERVAVEEDYEDL